MTVHMWRFLLLLGGVFLVALANEDCSKNPCLNQGICQDTDQGYVCICKPGFSGRNCESENDDCKKSNPCQNGACKLDSAGNPRCFCSPGFAGQYCEIDEDECQSQPCLNSGKCLDKINGFSCDCTKGTYGRLCEITQEVINEFTKVCSSEETARCWREHNEVITVEWGYGDYICNTVHTCFGGENDTETNTFDRFVDVQLRPAQLQVGDSLNLTLDENMKEFVGKLMPDMLPVVQLDSKESFVSCNSSRAIPVVSKPSDSVIVGPKELMLGFHYFMTNIDSTFKCEFGLRLNVSVKENHCKHPDSPHGEYCLQRGRCQTNFSFTDYRCECFTGFYGEFCDKLDYCYNSPCKHGRCINMEDTKDVICECDPGFIGYDCSIMLDMCLSSPCQNNATCIAKPNEYQCVCPPGFTGRNCEINIDECAPKPCLNSATCEDGINTYNCKCLAGFEGRNCEINIDDCKNNRCKFGVCVDHINKYKCKCDPGYVGIHCEYDMDECLSKPCQHGGRCNDQINGYKCDCQFGYQGENCQVDLDLCSDPLLCTNAQSCVDHGTSLTCNCSHGYSGANCATPIDWCTDKPCLNGARCILHPPGYSCECPEHFSGRHCEINMLTRKAILLKVMMEDCHRIKSQAIHDFYYNISSVIDKACQCSFTVSNIVPNSLNLHCENSISAQVDLEIETKSQSPHEVLCKLKQFVDEKKVIHLAHDSFIVKVLTEAKDCKPKETGDKEKIDKEYVEDEKEEVDMSSVAVAIGLCIALIGLGAATFFILYRCRRRVEAKKEKARTEDKRSDGLGIDLLSAVAPTPKSLYRTSAYRGSIGYNNLAFSSPYDIDNSNLKSRKV